jgi:hypothetical protein
MTLEPADDVLVGVCGPDGGLDVDTVRAVQVRIKMTFEAAHQICREKRVDLRLRRLRDEFAEARQRHAGGPPLIDDGGHARTHADHVGIESETARHILIDMAVGVDQAGQYQFAFGIDDVSGGAREYRLLQSCDAPVPDREITNAIDAARRTDDAAPFDQKVVTGGFHHLGLLPYRANRTTDRCRGMRSILRIFLYAVNMPTCGIRR